jgi:hypothetical protein
MGVSAAIAAAAGGGIMQATGQIKAGKYQRALAYQQANVMDTEADYVTYSGDVAANKQRIGVRRLIGDQRASAGAQGIAIDEGSIADIQADTAKFGEMDALTILQDAAVNAWSLRTQGNLTRAQGDNAAKTGRQQAFATILGTGGSIAGARYGWK